MNTDTPIPPQEVARITCAELIAKALSHQVEHWELASTIGIDLAPVLDQYLLDILWGLGYRWEVWDTNAPTGVTPTHYQRVDPPLGWG